MIQQVENETKQNKKKGAVDNIKSEEMSWRESSENAF